MKLVLALALGSLLGCQRPAPTAVGAPRSAVRALAPPRSQPALLGEDPSTTMLAVDAGIAGDRISGLLQIPPDQCAVVIARAGASVEDLDLFAYGDDGSVVGSDEGTDKTPGLLICPPHPGRIWVAARIAAGNGLVAVGSQRVAPAEAERAAARYGLRGPSSAPDLNAEPFPGFEEHVQQHRREIGGDWQNLRRVPLPLDAKLPARFSAAIEANSCVEALLLPSVETARIELVAFDEQGAVLTRAASDGRDRFVVVCAPLDTTVAFEARPQAGQGQALLLLSRTQPGSERALTVESTRVDVFASRELELEQRDEEARLAALYARQPARRVAVVTPEVARRTSLSLRANAGCSRFDLIAGAPQRGTEAWLYSSNYELLAHASSGRHATLFACGRGGGLRLDIESTLRKGPLAVLQHADADVPAALLAHPLAAGRLLADVIGRGVLRRPSEIGQVTEFALSDAKLETMDLTVPVGRCIDVALALDRDANGAEVRLVSVKTGAEIARGSGAHAANARVCAVAAGDASDNLKTRVELRAEVGGGSALVATRMLTPAR